MHKIYLLYARPNFRQGASRYLVLTKKDSGSMTSKSATFQLVRNSRYQIGNMLQRFPVSSKERLELLPNTDKSQVNEGTPKIHIQSNL